MMFVLRGHWRPQEVIQHVKMGLNETLWRKPQGQKVTNNQSPAAGDIKIVIWWHLGDIKKLIWWHQNHRLVTFGWHKKAKRKTSQSSRPSTFDFETLPSLAPVTSSNIAWWWFRFSFRERFLLWLWLSTQRWNYDFLFQFWNNISQALQKMDPSVVNLKGDSVFLLVACNQLTLFCCNICVLQRHWFCMMSHTLLFCLQWCHQLKTNRKFLSFVLDEISDLFKFGYKVHAKKFVFIIFPQILIWF